MARENPVYASLDDWIARAALPFDLHDDAAFHVAVERLLAELGPRVEVLGFGEPLHGGEEFLQLRNRFFQRLVVEHGYRAIAIESSFTKAQAVDDYVAGRGPSSYEDVQQGGFDHGFGKLAANRELIEWLREHNAGIAPERQVRFYGFDMPVGLWAGSPAPLLKVALDYLAAVDGRDDATRRERIAMAAGPDAAWENPASYADPTQRLGQTPAAQTLRIETEDLLIELRTRRRELVAQSDAARFAEALHYAGLARIVLAYQAAFAKNVGQAGLLGIRDLMMADTLAYLAGCERERGKLFVFAHNSHLQQGRITAGPAWTKALGNEDFSWWSAGSLVDETLGERYAVIGSAVGTSEPNGIGEPEPGTLEARLLAAPGPGRFVPTHRGRGLPCEEIARLPVRTDSTKNLSYMTLTPQSFTNFDALAVLDSATYSRGGPPLR